MEEGEGMVIGVHEKQTVDGGPTLANGHASVDIAVNQSNEALVEGQTAGIQIPPMSPQTKSQDTRAEAFAKQYKALQQQLRQRDVAMMELADENENLNKAFTEVKEALKGTVADHERLMEKIKRQQISLQTAEASLRKAQMEAVDAKREANEARRDANEARNDANDARRETMESSVALADAKAEVWAIREAAKGKALGEDERRELEGAVRALSASAQRAAQEAGTWREKTKSWKEKVDSLSEELDGKVKALAALDNELALAWQSVKDCEVQVREARLLQDAAENALQELRQESDRRIHTFNTAVKAAVSKIQTDLESERNAAMERVESLQSSAESQAADLREANEVLTAVEHELLASKTTIRQLEEERQETKEQLGKLQEQVAFWQSAAEAAEERNDSVCKVAQGLTEKVLNLESHCEQLTSTSDSAARNAAMLEEIFASDISRMKSALASAQNEKQALQVISSEKVSSLMAQQIKFRASISDLELQVKRLEAQVLEQQARSEYGLGNLGLERVNWKSKLRSEDVEKHKGDRTGKDSNRASLSYDNTSWSWLQIFNQETSLLRGRLSQRSMVMVVYIVILHIMVMVSFTQKSHDCVELVGQNLAKKLPGF